MRIIVGLGNPGKEYAGTPHNLGFLAIDALAEKRQLETKATAVGTMQIARVIPPLGLKLRMIEVIARERVAIARCSETIVIRTGAKRKHKQ